MKTIPVPLTIEEIKFMSVCLKNLHKLGDKLGENDKDMERYYYNCISKLNVAMDVYDEE